MASAVIIAFTLVIVVGAGVPISVAFIAIVCVQIIAAFVAIGIDDCEHDGDPIVAQACALADDDWHLITHADSTCIVGVPDVGGGICATPNA